MTAPRRRALAAASEDRVHPLDVHHLVHKAAEEHSVPDPIEWVLSDRYLDLPHLYPRQATFLKLMFLAEELFTPYDLDVIGEWSESFRRTGNQGCQPDILERVRICREQGRSWFREVVAVIGRRGSKGYMGALALSYVLWCYMHRPGGPQQYYGVAKAKKLTCLIFGGKRAYAKANQWQDLTDVITGAPCFTPWVSRVQAERLSVFCPTDIIRAERLKLRGLKIDADLATFEIVPRESTLLAGRGPTSFCLDPATPVLTADLRWVPIGEVSEGDRLVGLDEYPERLGAKRKLRSAEVLKVWRTRKAALRLTFVDGSSVVCSKEHRWLVRDVGRGGAAHWRTAARMRVGNHIKHVVDPWEEDRSWEGGYLAGVYDGEGCVSGYQGRAGKSVLFTQNAGPVLDKTLAILKDKGFDPQFYTNTTKKAQEWSLSGLAESMRFLGSVRPTRLLPRARGVWEGVAPRGGVTPSGRARPDSYKTITSIEDLPEQDLVDIETSTRTFIANGLISHNSQAYDEMAHVVNTGSNRDAEGVYQSSTPSLDQFGMDAFLYEGSSPWQMTGQFYTNWGNSLALEEDGSPSYPEMLMVQLPSWGLYEDWQIAHKIAPRPKNPVVIDTVQVGPGRWAVPGATTPGRFPEFRSPVIAYDAQMRQVEKANPETFAVERLSHWAAVLDAYLNEQRVLEVFRPWGDRELRIESSGAIGQRYVAHGDPANVNDRFGFAIAHLEEEHLAPTKPGEVGMVRRHVVFDVLHKWEAGEWEDNQVHYTRIEDDDHGVDDDLWEYVRGFMPVELTFDQFASPGVIQNLTRRVRSSRLPRRPDLFIVPATERLNWARFECFKAAINLGLVHAPMYDQQGEVVEASEIAELELRHLQKRGKRVDHPTSGPVQTKDICDCMVELVWKLIGAEMAEAIGHDLSDLGIRGVAGRGIVSDPASTGRPPEEGPDVGLATLTARGRPEYSQGRTRSTPGYSRGGHPGAGRQGRGRPTR